MQDIINEQINAELYSAYLYRSMSADLESKGLPGFANWMKVQAQEEDFHAMKFFDYLNERGGRVILKDIKAPKTQWASPLEIFQEAYNHEILVTSLINKMMDVAIEEKDYASQQMLQWFVEEQVEEEASAEEIVNKLKLIGDGGSGLFHMDKDMAGRVFTPPAKE